MHLSSLYDWISWAADVDTTANFMKRKENPFIKIIDCLVHKYKYTCIVLVIINKSECTYNDSPNHTAY